jgi:O-antigen chain-terminating methyltransferase
MAKQKFTIGAKDDDGREIESRIEARLAERRASDPEYGRLPEFSLPEVASVVAEPAHRPADVQLKDAHITHLLQTIAETKDSSTVPEGVRLRRLKGIIQKLIRVHSRLQNFFNGAVAEILNIMLERSQKGLDGLTARVEDVSSQIADARSYFTNLLASVKKILDENQVVTMETISEFENQMKSEFGKARSELAALVRSASAPALRMPEWALDSFDYVDFENKYYGSRESIADKQKMYVGYFEGCSRVLDLGCGSGGFLSACREAGISAAGVDVSRKMVDKCVEAGLDAAAGDGIEYLSGQPDGALDGIFCAQVLEHLYPAEVVEFFRLCDSKTGNGAILVIELPNIRNLGVFARSFYSDMSHVRPYSREIISFLGTSAGFGEPEIITSSPIPESDRLKEIPWEEGIAPQWVEVMNANIGRLNSTLAGDQDIAFVFRKA